jgi:hypothetical protein
MRKKLGGASMVADRNFTLVGEARVDSKHRVVIKGPVSKHYLTYVSDSGQILLEPMSLVPTRSIKDLDPKTLASVRRGIKQAKQGKGRYLGSFAKYLKDD